MIDLFARIKSYFYNPCTTCVRNKRVLANNICKSCVNYEYSLAYEIDNYYRDKGASTYTFSKTGTARYEDDYVKKCLDALDESNLSTIEDILRITRDYND